jgi:hypothetical protein
MNPFYGLIEDLFADNSIVSQNIGGQTNITVAQMLIQTRHMWGRNFVRVAVDESELTNLILMVSQQISERYPKYAQQPDIGLPPYPLRAFDLKAFYDFLNDGKEIFSTELQMLKKVKQQQIKKNNVYPAKQYKLQKGECFVALGTEAFLDMVENNFRINNGLVKNIQVQISQNQLIEIPKVFSIDSKIYDSMNIECGVAAATIRDRDIQSIPVIFSDDVMNIREAHYDSLKKKLEIIGSYDQKKINSLSDEKFVFYIEQQQKKFEGKISWKQSDFSYESDQFKKIAVELKQDIKNLEKNYKNASMAVLTDNMWSSLSNTESWNIKTAQEYVTIAKRKNKNYRQIAFDLLHANKQHCPIAIRLADNSLRLIAGDVRLMLCRLLKIQPKIVLMSI